MSRIENICLTPSWKQDYKNIWNKGKGCINQKIKQDYLGEWISPCYNENKEYINYLIEQNKMDEESLIIEKKEDPHKIAYKIFYKIGNWMEYVYDYMYKLNEDNEYSDYEEDDFDIIEEENNDQNDIIDDYDDDNKNNDYYL